MNTCWEYGILPLSMDCWTSSRFLGLRCMDTCLGVRKLNLTYKYLRLGLEKPYINSMFGFGWLEYTWEMFF